MEEDTGSAGNDVQKTVDCMKDAAMEALLLCWCSSAVIEKDILLNL